MSHAQAWLKFNDGSFAFAEYDGTGDLILSPYYLDYSECRARWRDGSDPECECGGATEEALYAHDYGGEGTWGPVEVCRGCRVITSYLAWDPDSEGWCGTPNAGYPDWVEEARERYYPKC